MGPQWLKVLLLGALLTSGRFAAGEVQQTPSVVNIREFPARESLTCGIQEAIDALPAAGGVVYIPSGTYTIDTSIVIRPKVTLRGDGRSTVLRQGPTFTAELAEDAVRGKNHVVVKDASRIRAGMLLSLGDGSPTDSNHGMDFLVGAVDGTKVYYRFRPGSLGGSSIGVKDSYLVTKGARLVKSFSMLAPAHEVTIENLMLDGASKDQSQDRICFIMGNHTRARGIYPIGQARRIKVRQVTLKNWAYEPIGAEWEESSITDCEIFDNPGYAIHFGPIKNVTVADCRLHNNLGGIYWCSAGPGPIIVRNNFIYDNKGPALYGVNLNVGQTAQFEDKNILISGNAIYNNGGPGIDTSQMGGGRNMVISGNLIYNNVGCGIALMGARFCTVTGNRLFDDRVIYENAALSEDAPAGAKTLKLRQFDMTGDPPWESTVPPFRVGEEVVLRQNNGDEERNVVEQIAGLFVNRTCPGTGVTVTLKTPLRKAYRVAENARVSLPVRQKTGIVVAHHPWDKYVVVADHNVISGNNCAGSLVGISVVKGVQNQVFGNLGRIEETDAPPPGKVKREADKRQQYWPEEYHYLDRDRHAK